MNKLIFAIKFNKKYNLKLNAFIWSMIYALRRQGK